MQCYCHLKQSAFFCLSFCFVKTLSISSYFLTCLHGQASTQEAQNEAVALHASLLTFQDLIYPLDGSWALSGLGHEYNVDVYPIRNAAVLHFNGKMKPWLELGIPKYKGYWKNFVSREDQFLIDCNWNS